MFQKSYKPTCIDLILTNQPNCFQHSNVFETGFSDFHLLTTTKFKMSFQKLPPKIVTIGTIKILTMKNLGRISPNLILMLLIWKASRIQSSVFFINMSLSKKYIFVQMKLHLRQRNYTKPL